MSKKFEEKLLSMKQKKFSESTSAAAEALGVPPPYINFEGCDSEGDELSHFHPERYQICVSRRQLYRLNFDDIHDVAIHEVTHILELEHNSRFNVISQKVRVKSWKPPRGVLVINSQKKKNIHIKKKKVKPTECSYHSCNKEGAFQCKFCNCQFCFDHAKPRNASYAPLKMNEHEATRMKWDDGHPCPEWTEDDYWKKKAEKVFNDSKYDALIGRTTVEEEVERRYRSMDNKNKITIKPIIDALINEENRKIRVARAVKNQSISSDSKKVSQGIIDKIVAWFQRLMSK